MPQKNNFWFPKEPKESKEPVFKVQVFENNTPIIYV